MIPLEGGDASLCSETPLPLFGGSVILVLRQRTAHIVDFRLRDRVRPGFIRYAGPRTAVDTFVRPPESLHGRHEYFPAQQIVEAQSFACKFYSCLLYTSDAADEL